MADQHTPIVTDVVHNAVAQALGNSAYDCTRVWSAWGCGTMSDDDFVAIADDGNRVNEIASAALEAAGVAELLEALKVARAALSSADVRASAILSLLVDFYLRDVLAQFNGEPPDELAARTRESAKKIAETAPAKARGPA